MKVQNTKNDEKSFINPIDGALQHLAAANMQVNAAVDELKRFGMGSTEEYEERLGEIAEGILKEARAIKNHETQFSLDFIFMG